MRLFIAIDIPDDIKISTDGFIRDARYAQNNGVVYVKPDNFHITLKFIGETDPVKIEAISGALEEISFEPFRLRVAGTGSFPEGELARVLWIGLHDTEPLARIASAVDRRLFTTGIPRDTRPFSPHLTIARVKKELNTAMTDLLRSAKDLPFGNFTVNAFHIYRSVLGAGGPVYTKIRSFPSH
jgi:RNA 2',3'-cyclic 3'-phosphodiesterase